MRMHRRPTFLSMWRESIKEIGFNGLWRGLRVSCGSISLPHINSQNYTHLYSHIYSTCLCSQRCNVCCGGEGQERILSIRSCLTSVRTSINTWYADIAHTYSILELCSGPPHFKNTERNLNRSIGIVRSSTGGVRWS